MTYRSEDLLFHDHEHGAECPMDPYTLPKEQRRAMDRSEFNTMDRRYREHVSEFPAEARGVARIAASFDSGGEALDKEIGGPDDVLRLITDLSALYGKLAPDRADPVAKIIMTYQQQHTDDLVRRDRDAATIAELRGIVEVLKIDVARNIAHLNDAAATIIALRQELASVKADRDDALIESWGDDT